MSTQSYRSFVDGEGALEADEAQKAHEAFAARHPVLALAFGLVGDGPPLNGALECKVKGVGGKLQLVLNDRVADEFAFLDVVDPTLILEELEAAIRFRTIRWMKNTPKKSRAS